MTAHWVDDYLSAQYLDGARGPAFFDCWGLVRDVRHKIFGCALSASWGEVRNDNFDGFTAAYSSERDRCGFEKCEPEPGAIAVVFNGYWVYHVAVVVETDKRLQVLEIRRSKGVTLSPLADFQRRCRRVEFYRGN